MSILARKGTVKDLTHKFKTPGSSLSGGDKTRFETIQSAIDKISGDVNPPPDKDKLAECFRLCATEPSPKVISQVVFLLRRKIAAKQYRVAENSLLIIQHFVRYGDGALQSSIGSNFFLMELVRLINKYNGPKPTDSEKALQKHMLDLIHAWGVSFDNSSFRAHATNYISVYFELKQDGFTFEDFPNPDYVPLNVIKISPRSVPGVKPMVSFRSNDVASSVASDVASDQAVLSDAAAASTSGRTAEELGQMFGDAAFADMEDVDREGSVISLTSTGEPKVSEEEREFNRRHLENFEKTQQALRSFDPFSQPQYDEADSARYHIDSAHGAKGSGIPPETNSQSRHVRNGSVDSTGGSFDSDDGGKGGFLMEFGAGQNSRIPPMRRPPSSLDPRYISDGGVQGSPNKDIHSPHGSVFSDITMESRNVTSGVTGYNILNSIAPPAPPPLLDRMVVSLQLLRELLIATTSREELVGNDIARDVSLELKTQHKLLMVEMDKSGKTPVIFQQYSLVHEVTMETLWSYDSIFEGKVSVFEVKNVLRAPKSASASLANLQSSTATSYSNSYNPGSARTGYSTAASPNYGGGYYEQSGVPPYGVPKPPLSGGGMGYPPVVNPSSSGSYVGSSSSSVGSQGRAPRSSTGGRFNVVGGMDDDVGSTGGGSRGPARSGSSVTSNNSWSRSDMHDDGSGSSRANVPLLPLASTVGTHAVRPKYDQYDDGSASSRTLSGTGVASARSARYEQYDDGFASARTLAGNVGISRYNGATGVGYPPSQPLSSRHVPIGPELPGTTGTPTYMAYDQQYPMYPQQASARSPAISARSPVVSARSPVVTARSALASSRDGYSPGHQGESLNPFDSFM